MEKQIGIITHFFDKIGVAVIKLSAPLKVGDQIRIEKNDGDFTQLVESIQDDKKPIESAKKGDDVGLKVSENVKEGNKVFLLK